MPRYVALLRGINIGAKKRIVMADLRALVEGLGYADVKTYANSGNVVFSAANSGSNGNLGGDIEAALTGHHGLDVSVVVRSGPELARIVAANPFPEYANEPTTLHVSFLSGAPAPHLVDVLAGTERGDDDFRVIGREVYLHYPNGMSGAVFMVNGLDRALGVVATSRNWRTVLKLADMARAPSG